MLIDEIKKDHIHAVLAKDIKRKDLLDILISESSKEDKIPNDDIVISVIKKIIKNLEESKRVLLETYTKSEDQVQAINLEIFTLQSYLPVQMSEDIISKVVNSFIYKCSKERPNNIPSIGDIMVFFNDNFKNQYDTALVSKIGKELLENVMV